VSAPVTEEAIPAPPEPGDGPAYLSHRQILTVLFGVMAGMLLAALDQSIVGTALPRIVSELGGLDKLSWVVTAYLLTSTAVTPLWGKISDLYGRRLIFQAAISIFIAGSALSGLAANMTELIAFRALQGIGGGGLFAIALAIIGDVIPPRERGRYQGYFGAVFGVSSIAGPLLGGWFTDGPGWRWIFYVNVPIGIAALVITSAALKLPVRRREHAIDYAGAAAIVASVASLLLYLNWRGKDYGWGSASSLALLGAALVFAIAFVAIELRAAEPIIPMKLFRNATFRVGNIYGFLAGIVMFGTIIFLPVYFQAVKGFSPTRSGLAFLPAMVGVFGTSIPAGLLISKTGRYKIFPIVGAVLLTLSLFGLSRLGPHSPYWHAALWVFLLGAGLGLTMQTILTAIQNAVDYRDLGTATAATTFFRQIGGAIGAAAFGAVLSSRLTTHLGEEFGGHVPANAAADTNNVKALQQLTGPVKEHVLSAFSNAVDDVFMIGIPITVLAFFVALTLKEIPLRTRAEAAPAEA
jgi:EmrB/QacA subfamily drug resistance transporter